MWHAWIKEEFIQWFGWKVRKGHYKDLDIHVCGRIIIKRILERKDGVVWIGSIWLRIGAVVGSCEHDNEPSCSIKRLGNS
jgi:hypothetical protein